jgi:glutathione reductase (NADPH)
LGENNLKVYIKNEDSGEISFEIVEKVLTATGRIPNTLGLNLDKVGIKTKKDGSIEVDEYENTSI